MPLVRAAAPSPDVGPPQTREALLEQLIGGEVDARRAAARALSVYPDTASTLAARLDIEPGRDVREALFASLVEMGGGPAAELIGQRVRSLDAGLRSGAVEALKRLGAAATRSVDGLLDDPDPDVRLLAIEVTRAWPSVLASPRLHRIIDSDPHVNVCGAAVDVATEVGAVELVEALVSLRTRFADEPFLVFAVDVALCRIDDAGERDL